MTRKQEIIQASLIQEGVNTDKEMKCFMLGANWADMNPMVTLDADYAWKVYNFINDWKAGKYGEIPLQKALYEHRI